MKTKTKTKNDVTKMPPFTHVAVWVPKDITAEELATMAFSVGRRVRIMPEKSGMMITVTGKAAKRKEAK